MSWSPHPSDRLASYVNTKADKSGYERRTVGWLRAYRAACAEEAKGAEDYLASLDARIANMAGNDDAAHTNETSAR